MADILFPPFRRIPNPRGAKRPQQNLPARSGTRERKWSPFVTISCACMAAAVLWWKWQVTLAILAIALLALIVTSTFRHFRP